MDLMIVILMLVIPAIAQVLVTSNYSRYKALDNEKSLSGFEVARKILDSKGLQKIYVVETKGNLTDHYDPKRKVVRLSTEIYHGKSIASLAVAAHECGHAIQDKEGYLYMKMRSILFPVVNVATMFSYFVIFLGVLLEALDLVFVGIGLVGTGLVFQIVTLPVEIDASKRAEKMVDELKMASKEEQNGVNKMLMAAGLTYVAGVLASALELLRLVLIFTDNRNK